MFFFPFTISILFAVYGMIIALAKIHIQKLFLYCFAFFGLGFPFVISFGLRIDKNVRGANNGVRILTDD